MKQSSYFCNRCGMLEFIGVRKSYGFKTILDISSLELSSRLYWLQGPNGSGKTTLLRVLAGILPFRGNIRLCGVSLRDEPVAYRRAIGWADAEIRFPDALEMALTGYSLLILVGCCLTVIPLRVSDFIKLWLVFFGIWYSCVLGGLLIEMSGLFAGAAVILFWKGYWRGITYRSG